jgi:hypothetical protein
MLAAVLILIWHFWPFTYDAKATLHRMNDGVTSEVLFPGATIEPGDQLQLEFEGSRELFVYVISHDERGEAYLLFPMTRSELKNPLPPGVPHRLPGPTGGMQLAWTVTSSGGREHMVIVASPERLKDFEAGIERLGQPRESDVTVTSGEGQAGVGDYPPVPGKALLRLRGIGGVAKSSVPATPAGVEIFKEVKKLAARAESARGAWVRQIDLEYAGR